MDAGPRRRVVDTISENVKSNSNGEEAQENHAGENTRADLPCHKQCESLFSSRSGFHNYKGLLNNCILLLVLSNSRNVIANFMKYGILVNPLQFGSIVYSTHWSLWVLFLISYAFPVVLIIVEKMAAKGSISDKFLISFYWCYFSVLLLLPAFHSFYVNVGPAYSFLALSWYTILWMKLVSYAQVNWWCRRNSNAEVANDDSSSPKLVQYPDNLSLKDMVYFLCAPTLCYELNFPRNKRRRKIFMIRRSMEIVFILNVNLAIMQQWIIPTALHSLEPFKDMDYARMVERVLLLALPNHLFWLLNFYLLFHSAMNLIGELLLFGDRRFYDDWWNAETVWKFWRTWNIPVHRWASRHIYFPLMSMGYSRVTGQMAVFALSAFFHEYLVSLPLQMIRIWAFAGMISQIPLGMLTALPFARGQIGNVIVWVSIVLGQPVAIMMYLHDYYWLHWALPISQSD